MALYATFSQIWGYFAQIPKCSLASFWKPYPCSLKSTQCIVPLWVKPQLQWAHAIPWTTVAIEGVATSDNRYTALKIINKQFISAEEILFCYYYNTEYLIS